MKKFLTLRVPTLLVVLIIALTLGLIGMKAGALITDYWDIGPWRVTSSGDLKPTGTTYDIGDATNRVAELNVDDIYIRKTATGPKIYVTVTNAAGHTLTNGSVVCWDSSTNTVVGVSVDTTTASGDNYIAGVIAQTIANGANGLMQIWGYHSAIGHNTVGVTAGYDIITSTLSRYGAASATDNTGIGIWFETVAAGSTGTAQGFLRGF